MNKIQAAGAGGTALGLGLLGVGVAGKNEDIHLDFTLLVEESDFDDIYSKPSNKDNFYVGQKYGWYLVGTYGADKDSQERNKKWWEGSYERLKADVQKQKQGLSEEFKNISNITKGYSYRDERDGDSIKTLNKLCESVYKKTSGEATFVQEGADKYLLARDLLRYCSPIEEKPLSVDDSEGDYEYYSGLGNVYGSNSGSMYRFISVFNIKNNIFWKLRNKEFFGLKGKSGSGSTLNKSSKIFYPLYSKKDWVLFRGDIKDACAESYTLDEERDKDKEALWVVLKYCTWE